MDIIFVLVICGIFAIVLIMCLIYSLHHSEVTDYDKWLSIYKEEKEKSLEQLELGNKEINRIEKEILDCKKKLHMKLFDK